MKKPLNPQAFPHLWSCIKDEVIEDGMTLRDYFAAKAMQSLVSNSQSHGVIVEKAMADSQTTSETTAILSYKIAEAMLKERANYE